MRVHRILMAIGLGALSAGSMLAQEGPGKCPPYPDGKKADASPIVNAIDTNKDGRMTHEEWQAAGAPEPSWNMFMKKDKVKKQGYITREDFLTETPPNGIDTNCDGKITIEEFLATKKWKMGGPPGGPPGGAPPSPPPQRQK
jgi:Ca2+-binding EF-hand superfamily protein